VSAWRRERRERRGRGGGEEGERRERRERREKGPEIIHVVSTSTHDALLHTHTQHHTHTLAPYLQRLLVVVVDGVTSELCPLADDELRGVLRRVGTKVLHARALWYMACDGGVRRGRERGRERGEREEGGQSAEVMRRGDAMGETGREKRVEGEVGCARVC
jgi:hypothetical protein